MAKTRNRSAHRITKQPPHHWALPAALTMTAIALIGCCKIFKNVAHAWTTQDAWYSPPPDFSRGIALPHDKIHPVLESQESSAEQSLSATSSLAISPSMAAQLTDNPNLPGPLFLMRGVYLNKETGSFSVYMRPDGSLLVEHDSLGHSPIPMKRQALVLELHNLPTKVFVTCAMAE